MEDHDITEAWKEHFPKWRHDKISAQTCRLVCAVLQDRVRQATTPEGVTPDEQLQRELDTCGIPRAQFDEMWVAIQKGVQHQAEGQTMHREMKNVIVFTDKKTASICIQQSSDDPGNESDPQVFLTPEQVPILIDWLQQAKVELDNQHLGEPERSKTTK